MEPHWFLTKPTDMIYTHFPQDPADQCLEPTIPVSTFFALPYVWASFFSHHIKMIRYNPHAIHLVDDQVCHLTFRVDPNVVCFAYIEIDPSLTLRCLAQSRTVPDQDGKSERIYKVKAVLPPGHDQGWLKIYAGTSSSFSSTTTTPAPVRQDNISNGTSLLISRHAQSTTTTTTPSIAPTTTTELPPLVMCFRLTHRRHLGEDRNRPFEFVHLHHHDFYIREPQCYHLYPLQTYNFLIRGGDDAHHKLAIKSPSGKLYKLMYYPQEHTYDGSVKIAESGKWSLISLLHHAGGWYVVATWECKS
jgi:transglutaminase/protease-like cytokinesis protein 3